MRTKYLILGPIALLFGALLATWAMGLTPWECTVIPGCLLLLGLRDVLQTKHSILRNYPIIGHLRYLIEEARPALRQYLVESDLEEAPFSRSQRSVVYQRAKNTVDARTFGTELNVNQVGHEFLAHSLSPTTIDDKDADFRVLVGGNRAKPYAMSVFNISAMSFGALSANAIRALNRGAKMGGFAHDTGEGSLSKHHMEEGGDIIWEIASGYFGCRTPDGRFDPNAFTKMAARDQVKMIEIKLSQGAKPGHGGVLPAAKITPEIAETRGIPMGKDCVSPSSHSEFSTPAELLQFVERLRTLSGGKPTGFKLCIGQPHEFMAIVKAMLETRILPDYIVVDGAEGGTGAAPVEFADHVGMPLQEGLQLVHNTLVGAGLREHIKLGASGKLITSFDIARAIALGADWANSGRGFMFSVGCIQSNTCNSNRCPTGVATQDPKRQKALVVPDKAERVYHFHRNTLHALKELLQAAGLTSPADLRLHHVMRRVSTFQVEPLSNLMTHIEPDSLADGSCTDTAYQRWWAQADAHSFQICGTPRAIPNKQTPPEPAKRVIWLQDQDDRAASQPATIE
ncbi:FMN-binding glutamate synthase family protein [Paraburkholderia sp. A3RO-2L]|uniref:FMN-binding glutamate synthase family protein n=1 Tax=Paraburkholderia sp. A3RO-2L TaxID=3028376 RepID=UPI00330434EA|nr:FMN-binding glutamate synthase family protein [Burkholderia vietnamiensis]